MSIYMLELYQYNIFPLCFYVISNSLKQCKALAPTILHWDIPLKFNDCPNNLILNHSLHWSPCFFSLSLSEIIPQGFFDLSSLKFLKNIYLLCYAIGTCWFSILNIVVCMSIPTFIYLSFLIAPTVSSHVHG